jgi:catechol 2,3-dioxygenase-like lactoylglutathione lyase family enzyme
LPDVLTRRLFLGVAAGAVVTPMMTRGDVTDTVPEKLDHILLGCSDLDRGIAFVEQHLGVKAMFGGVHPGRGTQNALLSLGHRHYLEIIAPDPAQPDSKSPRRSQLEKLSEPRLVEWAAHPGDLSSFAKRLQQAGLTFEGPTPGSRKRPDGRLLQWQTLMLNDDASGLLPFFIEWNADSPHPSADAPAGCHLVRFEVATPDPQKLAKTLKLLSLDVPVAKAEKPQLRAQFAGPKGHLELTS